MFHFGLGTHFNAPVDPARLAEVATRFTSGRIDAQTSSPELTHRMIADVEAAGMFPITIIDTPEQQEALPDGGWVELQNEVNIGLGRPAPIPPSVYRESIRVAYEIAQRKGQTLCAGAAANLEKRDINWFHDLRFAELPADIVAVTHHYVPRDRFIQAHHIERWQPSTWTRQYEVDCFRAAIGMDRDWIITEFGYGSGPNSSLTPDEAAGEIGQEWPFWQSQGHCLGAWLYQIQDSPTDDHDFGLYDEHGQIKQAIFATIPPRPTVNTPNQESLMADATFVISKKDLIPDPDKPSYFAARMVQDGQEGVVSVQPDGRVEWRPKGSNGAYEECYVEGTKVVYPDVAGKRFAVPLVD